MAEVDLNVNGRSYRVACQDGEEEHLQQLARHVDARARELSTLGSPRVSDTQLMLMASLLVADDLSEALDRIEELETAARVPKPEPVASPATQAVLESAARRVEELAGRIRSA